MAAILPESNGRASTHRLIVFTRFPEPGQTKTRLIPLLGAEGAARLQRELTAYTLDWVRELQRTRQIDVEVRFASGNWEAMKSTFGSDLRYIPQCDGHLGERLVHACGDVPGPTVIVGTDCPDLSARAVDEAFAALRDHDVVLGPALDGGYYLIGLNRPSPALFENIDWGTSHVLVQTIHCAEKYGLTVALLSPLADIDRPEDLSVWNQVQEQRARAKRR